MKSKVGAALFALVFALVFGAGGVFGVVGLFNQLNGWWQARSWQAVPATVLSAELKESHGDSVTYQAAAKYRYVINGRSYEGSRVGLDSGSDNVGSWQQDRYALLDAARRERRTIEVWVDPANPTRSVVDRKLRPALVALTVPFATLFPMVSIGAFWVLIRLLRTPAQEISSPTKPKPNEREIRSNARLRVWSWWGFAIIWSLIAFPVALAIVPNLYGRSLMWLAVMIFPVVGLLLIGSAIVQTLRLMRNGEITIRLSPAQPRLGESVTVHATFTQMPVAGEYVFTLLCEQVDTSGDDNRYRTVWKQERSVHRGGTYATATFSPPADLPESEPSATVHHRWRVLLGFPDGKDERAFDVTMGPAHEGSPTQSRESRKAGVVDAPLRPVPESLATIVDEGSGLSISYARNSSGSGLFIMLFGLVFTGVGMFLLFGTRSGVGPKAMGIVFALIGSAVFGAGVYSSTHRRIVGISNGQLRVENHWFLKSSSEECAIGAGGPADPAKAARRMKVVQFAVMAGAAVVILAMFWDIVGGLLPGRDNAGRHQAAPQLLESPDPLSKADRALFSAVERKGSADEVARALSDGANVKALNEWGATPLLVAARLSSADVVEALIRAGSNINFSVRQENEYRGRTPLMNAAGSGRGDNVRVLLKAGADAQAFESHGWSAAHYAANEVNLEGLRALREHGVNLDIQSPVGRGETPLMIAARDGELDSIRELIALGADPRAVDRHGENAYGWAKHFGQSEAMKALSAYK